MIAKQKTLEQRTLEAESALNETRQQIAALTGGAITAAPATPKVKQTFEQRYAKALSDLTAARTQLARLRGESSEARSTIVFAQKLPPGNAHVCVPAGAAAVVAVQLSGHVPASIRARAGRVVTAASAVIPDYATHAAELAGAAVRSHMVSPAKSPGSEEDRISAAFKKARETVDPHKRALAFAAANRML